MLGNISSESKSPESFVRLNLMKHTSEDEISFLGTSVTLSLESVILQEVLQSLHELSKVTLPQCFSATIVVKFSRLSESLPPRL